MWHCIVHASRIFPDGAWTTSGACLSFLLSIQDIFVVHLLCAQLHSQCWELSREQDRQGFWSHTVLVTVSYGNKYDKDIREQDEREREKWATEKVTGQGGGKGREASLRR